VLYDAEWFGSYALSCYILGDKDMAKLEVGRNIFPRSAFIGFDHLFTELDFATKHAHDHYPPHNIVRENDLEYLIEIAVAGFSMDDLTIEQKERSLTVTGERESKGREVIHRGISTKRFKRTFRLSEYVEVTGATLRDGILAISLKIELPEEKRPRQINIK
jgi:molecular chaperone IbpA